MTINNESAIGLEKYQINVEEFADSNLSFNFLVIEKFFDNPSKKKELLGKSVDEIYNEMPKLYQGRDFDEVVENVMKYVNTTYNDWERFFTPEQVEELVQQYTASLT